MVPTRKTSEQQLDQWNQAMRASPLYQNFLKKQGLIDSGRGVHLSNSQQAMLERELAAGGMKIPDGMHIDAGGNLNQKNHLLRNVGIGAAIGGGALTGFGLAGMGPMAGLFGGGAAGAGGGAAGAGAAFDALPAISSPLGAANAASLGWTLPGGAAAAGGAGAAAGAAGGASQGLMSKLGSGAMKGLSDPNNLASIAAVIAGLVGNRNSDQNSEEMKRIQNITETQMRRADPLHQVAVNLAFGRAPMRYRQGVQMNNLPLEPRNG